jgi:aminopeptidase N
MSFESNSRQNGRMTLSTRILVVFLAAAASAAGAVFSQEPPTFDRSALAKEELARRRRVEERMETERIRKSLVDQGTYDVLHYELSLDVDPASESISGTLSMEARSLVEGPASVVLDLFNVLTVSAVRERGAAANFSHANDLLTVNLSGVYAAGDTIRVEIDYGGNPTGDNDELNDTAFSFAKHGPNPANRDQLVIYTISEPFFARAWWPCKDVPGDKATARLRITVPDTLVVASNGVLEGEAGVPGGKKTYTWYEKYPIATYLVSLAISNYVVFDDYFDYAPAESMQVVCYAYPEHEIGARLDFTNTVRMLEIYSDLFGLYPFVDEKYGMAEFGWAGAMEHQTCTSMGSVFFAGTTRRDDWVVAHELAHQWWGDLVTPADWADVWLNEGFATYSEALWVEATAGPDSMRVYMSGWRPSWGFRGTLYDPENLFGTTVYRKGGWVLHMLRGVMGDEVFFAALRDYGSEESFGYGNATTADFQRVCEEHYGGSLQWFFDEWVYGEGEPVYAYYWASAGEGMNASVDLSIRQVQTDGIFAMPIEVRFSFASGDTTVTVWNDGAVAQQRFAFGREVLGVVLDPDAWILASVEERRLDSIALSINPNPFNSSARVGFEMGNAGSVEIDVYDVTGAYVQTLLRGSRGAGYHEITWDGSNAAGQSVSSGVYFVRIHSAAGTLVRKAVMVE